jgi:sortase B
MSKAKSGAKKIICAVLILLLIALIAVAVYILQGKIGEEKDKQDYINYQKSFISEKPTDSEEEENYLADCLKVNPQTVAWLTIPDTEIDFPIVQCEDNEYYLSHGFDGEETYFGVPFLDYRNTSDFSDFNSIIYGHNISNKYVFAPLLQFKNSEYFAEHPYALLTLAHKKYRINFLSCMVIESDGFVYSTVFTSKREKEIFVRDIEAKATCKRDFPDLDLETTQFVTLSTCSYEFTNARTVLIGYLEEIA